MEEINNIENGMNSDLP